MFNIFKGLASDWSIQCYVNQD